MFFLVWVASCETPTLYSYKSQYFVPGNKTSTDVAISVEMENKNMANPVGVDGAEQLVDATTLLQIVWPDGSSRPSLRWLREQQKRRTVPYVKIGNRVWFLPSKVREHFCNRWTCKAI